jgi:murein DD-endopeptidase MepM/ murein hydrolase activator NlpD
MHLRTPAGSAVFVLILGSLAAVPACYRDSAPIVPRQSLTAADVRLAPETLLVRAVVPRSATLDRLLQEHGLGTDVAARVIESVRRVFDPRRLRSLQPFLIERTVSGALRAFEYEIDADSFLRVTPADRGSGALKAEVLPIPKTLELSVAAGTIDADATSLIAAMTVAGEGDDLALKLAELFSGEIDFNSEVQRGDRFAVSFERFHREGRPSGYGHILSAEYIRSTGQVARAIRFTPPDGQPQYYDEQGRSLRRFFLKSPLRFEPRVTSRFNPQRRHPVLRTIRAHRGVDYGAPNGAPVVAVAAGTVVSVTSDNTNGRMVRLRHASGYQTYYLHLSRFASGLRAGGRVTQGDVIGYVGSSGLATGPHLHYGLTKNGVFVDPVAEHRKMPPGDPIPTAGMDAFRAVLRQETTSLVAAHRGDGTTQLASSSQSAVPLQ